MRFKAEARALYYTAHHIGKKTCRKRKKQGSDPYLIEIPAIPDEKRIAGTVDVGILDIPTEQIVGVASAEDRELYSWDFMPLNPAGSEFADQWCALYQHYLSDAGIRGPISCYEYMGRFYVLDGKKRVSVVKSYGAPTICASVTRILPVKTEEEEVQRYYEFLEAFEKTRLYQVALTKTGSFPKLQIALGYDEGHVWTESDRFSFMFNWPVISRAFEQAFNGYLKITTADALVTLLEDYSYTQIIKTPSWVLSRLFQSAWKKLYVIANPEVSMDMLTVTKKVACFDEGEDLRLELVQKG